MIGCRALSYPAVSVVAFYRQLLNTISKNCRVLVHLHNRLCRCKYGKTVCGQDSAKKDKGAFHVTEDISAVIRIQKGIKGFSLIFCFWMDVGRRSGTRYNEGFVVTCCHI